jgi:hypothetical protein
VVRILVLLAVVAAVLAACSSGAAGSGKSTSLTIAFWPEGLGKGDRIAWTLKCDPARGTLPRPGVACRKLAQRTVKLLAPVPKNVACTEIYGGPQVARIKGTLAGRPVWAQFARNDGCQIARWEKLTPWLLPRGGAA